MNKNIKIILTGLTVSLSISVANAGVLNFAKKHPVVTTVGAGALYLQSTMHKARDLSYNLQKVEPFFQANPQDFNPIAQYVLKALSNPNNKQDYDRYKKLAEIMGLDNIPQYIPTKNNQPIVLETPIKGNINPINERPIQEEPISNILINPQGKTINTSLEFPIERPATWVDYLLLRKDSAVLGENLDEQYKRKDPNWVRPDNLAAHHIIPAKDKEAQAARDILEKYDIDINDSINGVYLPTKSNVDLNQGIQHNGRHPKSYSTQVNELIKDADKNGGKQEVLSQLNDIKNKLENAPRNIDWRNVL